LAPDSVAMMTYGQGWVLSVPEALVEKAEASCNRKSFAEIAREGDGQQELWFVRGARDEERATVRNVANYEPLSTVAESLKVSVWSHYFHWYCDAASWSGRPTGAYVRLIQKEDQDVWGQWLRWPGPSWGLSSKSSDTYEAFGYVLDGRLVSVAQVVLGPEDFAWDFGVYTMPEFRGRGFAVEACRAATESIIGHGRVPWYYYNHYNTPSSRLPRKLGYFLYSEALVSHGG